MSIRRALGLPWTLRRFNFSTPAELEKRQVNRVWDDNQQNIYADAQLLVDLPVFADNTSALFAGLAVGAFYRTGADPDFICVVH